MHAAPIVRMLLTGLLVLAVQACSAQDVSPGSPPDTPLARQAAQIRESAKAMGTVRVMVQVQAEPGTGEKVAKVAQEAGATLLRPAEGASILLMEVDAAQLDRILETGLVISLQEDAPEMAH